MRGVYGYGKKLIADDMETLEIKVPDKQKAQKILKELEKRSDVLSVRFVPSQPDLSHRKPLKPGVNEVTLASETSLAKDWLSPEDDHWDKVYKDLCIKKAM